MFCARYTLFTYAIIKDLSRRFLKLSETKISANVILIRFTGLAAPDLVSRL